MNIKSIRVDLFIYFKFSLHGWFGRFNFFAKIILLVYKYTTRVNFSLGIIGKITGSSEFCTNAHLRDSNYPFMPTSHISIYSVPYPVPRVAALGNIIVLREFHLFNQSSLANYDIRRLPQSPWFAKREKKTTFLIQKTTDQFQRVMEIEKPVGTRSNHPGNCSCSDSLHSQIRSTHSQTAKNLGPKLQSPESPGGEWFLRVYCYQ